MTLGGGYRQVILKDQFSSRHTTTAITCVFAYGPVETAELALGHGISLLHDVKHPLVTSGTGTLPT
jgi:hypothetical protein